MARKTDAFYFDTFFKCADCSCRAANLLMEIMRDFDPSSLEERIAEMHAVEQEADELRHGLLDALVTAFITPIDREDIAALSGNLDAVTDHIEGVLHRLYFDNIQTMRPDALEMGALMVRACEEMRVLMQELPQLGRSRTLHDHVVAINSIEEEADRVFIRSMRTLHTTSTDPMEVIAWRETYLFLEYCVDSCEDVADNVGAIVMKNS